MAPGDDFLANDLNRGIPRNGRSQRKWVLGRRRCRGDEVAHTCSFPRRVALDEKNGQNGRTKEDAMNPEENAVTTEEEATTEELLVEEVSIDGLCGVY